MFGDVVLVRDFGFAGAIMVVAFLRGKFFLEMPVRVNRLEQYRKQYRQHQAEIDYGKPFFHDANVGKSKTNREDLT